MKRRKAQGISSVAINPWPSGGGSVEPAGESSFAYTEPSIVSRMNRTEPSQNRTLTPPLWLLDG